MPLYICQYESSMSIQQNVGRSFELSVINIQGFIQYTYYNKLPGVGRGWIICYVCVLSNRARNAMRVALTRCLLWICALVSSQSRSSLRSHKQLVICFACSVCHITECQQNLLKSSNCCLCVRYWFNGSYERRILLNFECIALPHQDLAMSTCHLSHKFFLHINELSWDKCRSYQMTLLWLVGC